MPELNDLPPELIEDSASFLDLKSLQNLNQTSQKMKRQTDRVKAKRSCDEVQKALKSISARMAKAIVRKNQLERAQPGVNCREPFRRLAVIFESRQLDSLSKVGSAIKSLVALYPEGEKHPACRKILREFNDISETLQYQLSQLKKQRSRHSRAVGQASSLPGAHGYDGWPIRGCPFGCVPGRWQNLPIGCRADRQRLPEDQTHHRQPADCHWWWSAAPISCRAAQRSGVAPYIRADRHAILGELSPLSRIDS